MKTLYIYLDESGNFDFSKKGTRHFVLCAMVTANPNLTQEPFQKLKYSLLEEGNDIEYFHASEDNQQIRNKVFETMNYTQDLGFYFIYADKNTINSSMHSPSKFYALLSHQLLDYCFSTERARKMNQIIVIFDKVLTRKQQAVFYSLVKPELKKRNKPFQIYFHSTKSDFNSQIADYATWALYVKLERNEIRPFNHLKDFKPKISQYNSK